MRISLLLALGLSLGVLSGCCNCKDKDRAAREMELVTEPITAADLGHVQELANDARLRGLLPPVRTAFFRDFRDVAVTGVRTYMSETGLLLSEITFLDAGEPFTVVYAPDGTPLPLADMPQRATTESQAPRPSDAPPAAPPAEAPAKPEREPAQKA